MVCKQYDEKYFMVSIQHKSEDILARAILRCRLFLSLYRRMYKVWDCSPKNGERELGLDRRETG